MHTHTYRSMRVCRCTEMARDTPGSPMSRPRDLVGGVGATTTTLTSSGYHTGSADPSTLHGHVLQQKILEVVYRSNSEIFFESFDFVFSLSLSLFQLQQHHQLQQQILRQQYQAQERQLAELHEQQMHQLKVSEIYLVFVYIYIYIYIVSPIFHVNFLRFFVSFSFCPSFGSSRNNWRSKGGRRRGSKH